MLGSILLLVVGGGVPKFGNCHLEVLGSGLVNCHVEVQGQLDVST